MPDQRPAIGLAAGQLFDADVVGAPKQLDRPRQAVTAVDHEHSAIVRAARNDGWRERGQRASVLGPRGADSVSGQVGEFPWARVPHAAALLAERP